MAEPEKKHECPNCERLERRATELEARVADLEGKLAKAQKNSATWSKPPSSDIVKPNTVQVFITTHCSKLLDKGFTGR